MNRIDKLFEEKPRGVMSVYFTAGYPDAHDTTGTIEALAARGVDMIEVGIPFSDPMADGPVIQRSNATALAAGMTLKRLFEQLEGIRRRGVETPLVMMGYLNPVMQYGMEAFCKRCAQVGADGVIIPDLPFDEYMEEVKPLAERHGLHFINLITPQTSEERIRRIDRETGGFIYMVSTPGATGARTGFDERTMEYFKRVAAMKLRNPRMIGFGISNAATLAAAMEHAAGAIVGSAFITMAGEHGAHEAARRVMEWKA